MDRNLLQGPADQPGGGGERGKRPTEADFFRYAQIGKPHRLTPSELDPITGYIAWPLLLRGPDLTSARTTLDRVFERRAASGLIDADGYVAVYRTSLRNAATSCGTGSTACRRSITCTPAASSTVWPTRSICRRCNGAAAHCVPLALPVRVCSARVPLALPVLD